MPWPSVIVKWAGSPPQVETSPPRQGERARSFVQSGVSPEHPLQLEVAGLAERVVDGAFRVCLPVTTFHGSKPARFGSDDAFDPPTVEASRPKVDGDQGVHPRHIDPLTVKAPANVVEILAIRLGDISKRLAHERGRAEMVDWSRRFKVLAAFSLQGDLGFPCARGACFARPVGDGAPPSFARVASRPHSARWPHAVPTSARSGFRSLGPESWAASASVGASELDGSRRCRGPGIGRELPATSPERARSELSPDAPPRCRTGRSPWLTRRRRRTVATVLSGSLSRPPLNGYIVLRTALGSGGRETKRGESRDDHWRGARHWSGYSSSGSTTWICGLCELQEPRS
jgi:hypothetical protein